MFLVRDGCICSQGKLLALIKLHGIEVLIRHGVGVGYDDMDCLTGIHLYCK